MQLTSPAFQNEDHIPKKYTVYGEDINPPLEIADIPAGTKTLVLIVEDSDAPGGCWTHWALFNISPMYKIAKNTTPGIQAINNFGKMDYAGPCPTSGIHRYYFRLFALDTQFKPALILGIENLKKALDGHVLEKCELICKYGN